VAYKGGILVSTLLLLLLIGVWIAACAQLHSAPHTLSWFSQLIQRISGIAELLIVIIFLCTKGVTVESMALFNTGHRHLRNSHLRDLGYDTPLSDDKATVRARIFARWTMLLFTCNGTMTITTSFHSVLDSPLQAFILYSCVSRVIELSLVLTILCFETPNRTLPITQEQPISISRVTVRQEVPERNESKTFTNDNIVNQVSLKSSDGTGTGSRSKSHSLDQGTGTIPMGTSSLVRRAYSPQHQSSSLKYVPTPRSPLPVPTLPNKNWSWVATPTLPTPRVVSQNRGKILQRHLKRPKTSEYEPQINDSDSKSDDSTDSGDLYFT
jgi:hypothetical protein